MTPRPLQTNAGFTLLEVALAIAFLGVTLTTLIAIETNTLKQYNQEEHLAKAALVAQYAITMMEVSGEPPEVGSTDGDLGELLKGANFFAEGTPASEQREFDNWTYSRRVTSISLPALGSNPTLEDVLRRVDLSVQWSNAAGDQFSLIYYMRTGTQAPQQN